MAIQKVTDGLTIVQAAGDTYEGSAADQTYTISPTLTSAGDTIVIIDQGGSNTIELAGGLTIASSVCVADETQLTLSNGAIVNIRGADTFTFAVGANTAAGQTGQDKTFAEFATDVLRVTLPAAGEAAVTGDNAVSIEVGGNTTVDPTNPTDVESVTLTEDTPTADYSNNTGPVVVTLDGDDDSTDGTEFDVTLSTFDDTVILDSYKDAVVNGGDGSDTINLLELSPGAGNGDVNLAAGTASASLSPGSGSTTLVNFENVIASDDGGRIVGTVGVNKIWLGEGTDDISTSGGDDLIYATDDTFASGTDTIDGGSGTDAFELTGEKTVTFAAADFTSVENIIIDGVDDDDVAITAADLFDSSSTTSGITGGVKNIKVVGGGDNTMTLTAAANSINLVGVTLEGINKGLTTNASAGSNNVLVDTESLSGLTTLTGAATDVLTLVGGGEFDYSNLEFKTLVAITGATADETIVFGNDTGSITTINGTGGDDTITFGGTLVGDISATDGNLTNVDTLDFGSANYVTVSAADADEFAAVTGTTGADTLVLKAVTNTDNTDLSGTALTGVETIVIDDSNGHELTIKSSTVSSGMLIQGDSGTDTLKVGGSGVSLEGVTLEAFEQLDVDGNELTSSTAALAGLALDSSSAGGKITLADNDAATLIGSTVAATLSVVGTADADDLTLKSFDDGTAGITISTGAGNDTVTLGSGNTLTDTASDLLLGAGDDTLNIDTYHAAVGSSAAADGADGGTGTDTLTFNGTIASGDLLANDFAAFEVLSAQNASIDVISVTLGASDIAVNKVDLSADTNATGDNVINLAAYGTAATEVVGSAGKDTITTSVTGDTVNAGAGNDSITLTGDNTASVVSAYSLTLGAGSDTVILGANTAHSGGTATDSDSVTITDFDASEDKIDVDTGLSLTSANFVAQNVAQAAVDAAAPSTLAAALTALEAAVGDNSGTDGTALITTVFQFDGNTYVTLLDDNDTTDNSSVVTLNGLHDLTAADNFILG